MKIAVIASGDAEAAVAAAMSDLDGIAAAPNTCGSLRKSVSLVELLNSRLPSPIS